MLKPWLFTEIKEQRHWDISSSERMAILQDFTRYGLEHWGSDTQGVEKTRRFLLEWLSFLCRWVLGPGGGGPCVGTARPHPVPAIRRYVPVGLLERLPQRINERPPYYLGRDYLETLMASQKAADWIRIRCQETEAPGCGRPRGPWAAGLTPPCALFTVRCCWDPCQPTSSFCRSIRPTRTSSRGVGRGCLRAQRGLLLHEKTINFILLKPRPFCDPQGFPVPLWGALSRRRADPVPSSYFPFLIDDLAAAPMG